MNEKGLNTLAAIVGIVILVSLALVLGYDGILLSLGVGLLSGLGGVPVLQELKAWYDIQTVKGFLHRET